MRRWDGREREGMVIFVIRRRRNGLTKDDGWGGRREGSIATDEDTIRASQPGVGPRRTPLLTFLNPLCFCDWVCLFTGIGYWGQRISANLARDAQIRELSRRVQERCILIECHELDWGGQCT